jgi:hypothetical protein
MRPQRYTRGGRKILDAADISEQPRAIDENLRSRKIRDEHLLIST